MIIRGRQIYESAPLWAKKMIRLVPFSYRLGGQYRKTLSFLEASDHWTREQYREYQRQQLGALLEFAIAHVPYYARYRRLLGNEPLTILREIEPVTKAQMQSDVESFMAEPSVRGRSHTTQTGGSSGLALKFHLDNTAVEREWAFIIALWQRAGYRPGDRRATFRGVDFGHGDESTIRHNPVYNELLLSPFHLTDEKMSAYREALRRFRPRFLRGYPSAISIFAAYLREQSGPPLRGIRGVLCGSENLLSGQRELIESVFNTRVYSWYGMTEKVVLAGGCERSTLYHAFPQYGITEVLNARGEIVSTPGEAGEIVGTGFLNRAMPFIRYRLDDHAEIVGARCDKCGRHHQLLDKVVGHHRAQDALVGKSGGLISLTALNLHDATFHGIRQFQYVQKERGKALVLVRTGETAEPELLQRIGERLRTKTGQEVEFEVQAVDRIDQTGVGKGLYLRQYLDVGEVRGETSH